MTFTQYRLVIFDADGTLRRCTVPGQVCPNADDQWELIEGVDQHPIWRTPDRVAIASNQGGVALGFLSLPDARWMLVNLFRALTQVRPDDWQIQVCPHAPTSGCLCRKPKPAMLRNAMIAAGVTPAQTLFVGDLASDQQAAQAAGCDFQWAQFFFSPSQYESSFKATPRSMADLSRRA